MIAILIVVVAVLSILVLGLLRSHADILRALHELGVEFSDAHGRERLPGPVSATTGARTSSLRQVVGVDPRGGSVSVSLIGSDGPTLLAFLTTGCLTCKPMWSALGQHSVEIPGRARPVVVTKGLHEESPAAVKALASPNLLTIMSSETWEHFEVPGSPYFMMVDDAGRVLGEGTASTWERVSELLRQALADAAELSSSAVPKTGGTEHDRLERVEEILRAQGIEAGHPSLYPAGEPTDPPKVS